MMTDESPTDPPDPPPMPPPPTPFSLPQWLDELEDPFVERRYQKELQFRMFGAIDTSNVGLLRKPVGQKKAEMLALLQKRYQKELQFRMVGAIEASNVDLLRKLVEKGVDTNATILLVKTPLTHAVEQDDVNYDVVKLLLDSNADPGMPDKTPWGMKPLHSVCAKGLIDIVNLFIKAEADVNVKDNGSMVPLHFAARYNQKEMVQHLIDNSAYVHATDNCGKTPLHRASEERNLEIVELLLNAGADINCPDNNGWSPIFHSVFFHHIDMVQFLILNGASVNCLNDFDESPLHIACSVEMPTPEIYDAISRSSFDFYRRTKKIPSEELKALMETRLGSNLDMIKLLVNSGASVNSKTTDDESPVLLADNHAVKRYLAAAGSRLEEDDLSIFSPRLNRYLSLYELEEDGTASQLCSGDDYRHLRWLKSHLYLQDTLKYLCRAAIRGYLGQTRDITCAIETLQLPKALKGFLSLNDVSEEF